ncbi:MAG: thioredoxin-disulfide reductase [Treponema sp.]|nr:thioredoxin-disulfide reductase [Treponema sp.]
MTDNYVDLLIIGAGPAGLTAAQYGSRANLKVLVIEQLASGGQALVIDVLENYPGNIEQLDAAGNVVSGIKSGYDFAMDLHKQAENFGSSFFSGSVSSLKKENDIFTISLADGTFYKAASVIIATGAKPRFLGVPGEKEFSGKGVSYCAACDGNFFRNKKIFVVGGGDAACDEARYLSRLTDKVILIHRRDTFRAQKALVERTINNPNIEARYNLVINEIKGSAKVSSVILRNTKTGEVYEEETDAVFIFAGTVPQSELAREIGAALDESGYIITDQKMATNIEGLFAAGDIRSGAFRQVVTAAADGAVAAHHAAEYIDEKN